jgi:anti-anti-sigma factor
MALDIRVEERRPGTKTLVLEGRLDHGSADAFDKEVDAAIGSEANVVVFDLAGLEYITSAGLRSIFRAQKAMNARAGRALLLNPRPQVQKVLDIVKVADLGLLFRSIQELDDYLDAMQKKVVGDE